MTTPFTYWVYHVPTGMNYYGVRSKKGCEPSDLWTVYFTSSKKVATLIAEYGVDSFHVEVRRTFTSKDAALRWEERVLRRMKVLKKANWLNAAIGGYKFCMTDVKHTPETTAKMSAPWKRRKLRNPEENGISVATREKLRIKATGPLNPFFGKTHSDEIRLKIVAGRAANPPRQEERVAKLSGWFEITFPNGKVELIKNLSLFCRENGLRQGCMSNVARGFTRHHVGFLCRALDQPLLSVSSVLGDVLALAE